MCLLVLCQMVVDALLLCFCEDSAINDGSAERPYYMNTSLMVNWLSIWFCVQMCCHSTLLWTVQLVSNSSVFWHCWLDDKRDIWHVKKFPALVHWLGDLWGPGLIWNAVEKCVSKTDVENDGTCSTYIHACNICLMYIHTYILACMYVCMYVHQTYGALNSDSLSGEASEWSLHIELRPK